LASAGAASGTGTTMFGTGTAPLPLRHFFDPVVFADGTQIRIADL
jgi:hypothetical protein